MVLRLVRTRWLASAVGVALIAPAAWLLTAHLSWESGWTDGVAFLSLATGTALLWTGLMGRQPDWMDPDS
jgi:hypothetical protein